MLADAISNWFAAQGATQYVGYVVLAAALAWVNKDWLLQKLGKYPPNGNGTNGKVDHADLDAMHRIIRRAKRRKATNLTEAVEKLKQYFFEEAPSNETQ